MSKNWGHKILEFVYNNRCQKFGAIGIIIGIPHDTFPVFQPELIYNRPLRDWNPRAIAVGELRLKKIQLPQQSTLTVICNAYIHVIHMCDT